MARENIIATLLDGRTIARGSATYVFATSGNYAISVTINEHRLTEAVFRYNLCTNPLCDPGTSTCEKITGNTVGVTLIGIGQGTTLQVEVIASGY